MTSDAVFICTDLVGMCIHSKECPQTILVGVNNLERCKVKMKFCVSFKRKLTWGKPLQGP
jgi:hypothetical protein